MKFIRMYSNLETKNQKQKLEVITKMAENKRCCKILNSRTSRFGKIKKKKKNHCCFAATAPRQGALQAPQHPYFLI